ncbi:MAG: phosphatase PAP2 family protein [Bacteroidetes bacterium]|nr:phosphatase PAP2 family protein [Bacteroidota bacterium]MBS1629247.1 phosphatase PAP2 family protein [Bacteroidota bacterium]
MNGLEAWLIGLDFQLWHYLHVLWRSPVLDALMPFARNQFTWAPLYLFLLVFMPWNFGKRGWLWCLGFFLCFVVADSVCGSVLKPWIQRVRPCNDPRFSGLVHLLVPRSSGWSFPSNHAANHFALGSFMAITLGVRLRWFWPLPIAWALLVSYAQVYVGVHWPGDVIVGGIIGSAIGLLMGTLFNQKWSLATVR